MSPDVMQEKGVVNKCPSCGAQVGAFAASCQSCGHEFTDIEANRSITALVERFDDIEREIDGKGLEGKTRLQAIIEKKARVIRDFPIPNSREDIQQLMYFIQPKIVESVRPDPNIEDWRAKFAEVLARAKNAYKGDSSALAEFDRMEESLTTTLSENLQIKAKRNPLFVALLAGIIVLALIGFVTSQMEQSKLKKCEEKYAQESQTEKARLEKLFASIDQDFKNKKYQDALTSSSKLQWEYEGTCKADENQKAKTLWDGKRAQITAMIQKTIDAEAAQKIEEANRQVAEKQAAEQKAVAAEIVKETKTATKAREIATDKEW